MLAAPKHFHGTMRGFPVAEPVPVRRVLRPVVLPIGFPDPAPSHLARMSTAPKPREFFIHGVTKAGKTFRPSDWSERLAGALSSFRPKGSGIGAHIGYSPYCVPRVIDGIK